MYRSINRLQPSPFGDADGDALIYLVKDLSTDARHMFLVLQNAKIIRVLTTVFDKKRK